MKKIISGISLIVIALTAGIAYANPSVFNPAVVTAVATTTVAYITPGTATTTLVLPSLQGSKNDKALVTFQYTASTTAVQLSARVESSFDNVEWYTQNVITTANATSTTMADQVYTFNMATSSIGDFGGSGTANRLTKSFVVDTQAPYTRVKFYAPIGGGNGALWASITPVKEIAY